MYHKSSASTLRFTVVGRRSPRCSRYRGHSTRAASADMAFTASRMSPSPRCSPTSRQRSPTAAWSSPISATARACAPCACRSVDTTMSFSALDGLPMGTRVGDLDPAVARAAAEALDTPSPTVRRPPSNHAEMPKRLFDRLTLVGRARLDVTIATGALRPTHGRYAVNLLDVSDPSRLRDETVVTLHELLNLGGGGHVMSSTIVPSCTRRPMMPA